MKVKQQPDDFRVEELTTVRPGDRGPFAFYRLEKQGWTTPDALSAIRRRWDIEVHRLAYGGLKDRHANTIQYISIFRGPKRGLKHQAITLSYLGQISGPYSSRDVRANQFQITLRDLPQKHAGQVARQAEQVQYVGIPNYFDDQRFGSVGEDREFVGRLMVLGRFEDALKLALTGAYEFDSAEEKLIKVKLLEFWGRWKECKDVLPRSHARSLVDYLVHHPTDFRGTLARTRPELQGMYLSAYQSDLWNRIIAAWLQDCVPASNLGWLKLKLADLPAPVELSSEQRAALHSVHIALPAARSRFDPNAGWARAAQQVLAKEGLAWDQLKIRGMRKPFFTRGERVAFVVPRGLNATIADDDRHSGRTKVLLQFELPRGSYATIVVKRVTMDLPQALA